MGLALGDDGDDQTTSMHRYPGMGYDWMFAGKAFQN